MANDGGVKHYFVDEAGDMTLFDKRGDIIVGNEGVSRCLMVGMVDIPDPNLVHEKLEELRRDLMSDPYFNSAPSMQPERKKTALLFHAKDDLPEVRYRVIDLLPSFEARAIAAIRRKISLAEEYQPRRKFFGKAFNPNVVYNRVYDDLVARIFRDKLHTADEINIVFARRGKSKRHEALRGALDKARYGFEAKYGKRTFPPTNISSTYPSRSAGLQVVDYYLWALQRMYERGEERFYRALEPQYRLIMDLDDKRNNGYGEWYSDANKLDPKMIWPAAS